MILENRQKEGKAKNKEVINYWFFISEERENDAKLFSKDRKFKKIKIGW